jgi:methanogenic corrinoid protein MtbC1
MDISQYLDTAKETFARAGSNPSDRALEDLQYHILALKICSQFNTPDLMKNYLGWSLKVLDARKIPYDNFFNLLQVLEAVLIEGGQQPSAALLDQILEVWPPNTAQIHRVIRSKMVDEYTKYKDLLIAGDRNGALEFILDIATADNVEDLYLQVFEPFQKNLGLLWERSEISIAQEHFCTASTQYIISRLYPLLFERYEKSRSNKLLASAAVGGETHEMGIRMVTDIFALHGWSTRYLGAQAEVEGIISILKQENIKLVLLGITLLFHLPRLEEWIELIHQNAPGVKILVGGYPFKIEPTLSDTLKADGWASDGREALARALAF